MHVYRTNSSSFPVLVCAPTKKAHVQVRGGENIEAQTPGVDMASAAVCLPRRLPATGGQVEPMHRRVRVQPV